MTEERDCCNCVHDDTHITESPCKDCMKHFISKKSKGIYIKMTCGEEHRIDTDQPTIETVKVNGKQVYPCSDKEETAKHYKTGDQLHKGDLIEALNKLPDFWGFHMGRDGKHFIINPCGGTMTNLLSPLTK